MAADMYPTALLVVVEPYEPTMDTHGGRVDNWGEGVEHWIIGLQPAGSRSAQQQQAGNRVEVQADWEALTLSPIGGPKARWTLPNGATAEQVGYPDDYSTGPWWDDAPSVSYLRRKEG